SPGGYFFDSKGEKQICGNGRYADLSIFSFHPVKHIAAGEGGMVTSNNKDLFEKISRLKTHGIERSPEKLSRNDGLWYYEMTELGFNFRITDIQCALANSQLKRLEESIKIRHEIAKKYFDAFEKTDFILPHIHGNFLHSLHLFVIQTKKRNELFQFLRNSNIFTQIHYIPVHYMPYYKNMGWKVGDFPIAENYYKNCLSIPMFPSLTKDEQNFVIDKIIEFMKPKS
ncbi:MAG: DegT/DnrJ/EryC1/StrS family aminotransferase, partial [Ignavibacteriae bacterium]|nr:DegT/DnrJ/EryC1/StrS family aminotransferase [Ignavibacteriota bacterium]